MVKNFLTMLLCVLVLQSCMESHKSKSKIQQQASFSKNCILDSISAVDYAKLQFQKRFGVEIKNKEPFTATMINDSVWLVTSSDKDLKNPPPDTYRFGGVLSIQIRKRDCEVLYINISK